MKEKMLPNLFYKISFLFLIFFQSFIDIKVQKTYEINYFENGHVKSHGWKDNGKKVEYWKYYYPTGILKSEGHYINNIKNKYWFYYETNGKKTKEGHYINGKKENWWSFYNNQGKLSSKCQYIQDKKNGYCIIYLNEKPIKALYFENDIKTNEWKDFFSFKKDNPVLF